MDQPLRANDTSLLQPKVSTRSKDLFKGGRVQKALALWKGTKGGMAYGAGGIRGMVSVDAHKLSNPFYCETRRV
jgi:hypothetical protein